MNGQKFSLSFSKRIEKKALQPSALRSEGAAEARQTEAPQAILALDQDSLRANENAEEEQLVIPLMQAKRSAVLSRLAKLHQEDGGREEGKDKDKEETSQEAQEDGKVLSLEERAELSLLEETKRKMDNWISRDAKKDITIPAALTSDPLSAPLVDIGKESLLEDYDEIAVESFGAAILRGMGWKKSEGIGGKKKRVVEIIDPASRTLGSSEGKGGTAAKKKEGEVGGEGEEEELPIVKGSYVFLHSGRHRGTYGVVEVVDEDHLLVRAAVGQAVIREVEANLRVASQKEYKESARVINKEMYDKYKEAEVRKKIEAKIEARHEEEDEEGSDEDGRDRKTKSRGREASSRSRDTTQRNRDSERVKQESQGEERNWKLRDRDSERQREKNERPREEKEEKQRGKTSERQRERDSERQRERDGALYRERDSERLKERNEDRQRERDGERHRMMDDRRQREEARQRRHGEREIEKQDRKERSREHRENEGRIKDKQVTKPHQDPQGFKRKQEESSTEVKQQKLVAPPWVRENLRVRLINKNYKGGKYHKEKVVVASVVTAECCECVAEGGRVLGDVDPAWLETVIPKQPPMVVMVVRGRHSGQKGRILQLHKEQEKASIQLLEDETTILKLHYDDICEYVLR